MLIDCPGCARSYHVSDGDLGRRGRTVICPHCDARWYQDAGGTIGRPAFRRSAGTEQTTFGLDEKPAPSRSAPAPTRAMLGVTAAVLAVAAFAGALIERNAVVARVPRVGSLFAAAGLPVDVVGLAFAAVRPERLPSSDVAVRGTLRNVAGHRVAIPRLAFEVRDAAGATLVNWSESLPARTLAADRRIDFTSQPHHLPAASRTVTVRLD